MRFFLTILIVAGLVATAYVVRDKRAEMRTQAWAQQLMPILEPMVDGTLNARSPAMPDEAGFFRLLYFLHGIETRDLDLREILTLACSKMDILGEKADLVMDSLLENYETAKKFQIFDEDENLAKLENGDPVPIRLSGWKDELCAVGLIVPPDRAPEVANCVANFVLLPATARDAQDGTISAQTQEHARLLSRNGFIDRLTLDTILQTRMPSR